MSVTYTQAYPHSHGWHPFCQIHDCHPFAQIVQEENRTWKLCIVVTVEFSKVINEIIFSFYNVLFISQFPKSYYQRLKYENDRKTIREGTKYLPVCTTILFLILLALLRIRPSHPQFLIPHIILLYSLVYTFNAKRHYFSLAKKKKKESKRTRRSSTLLKLLKEKYHFVEKFSNYFVVTKDEKNVMASEERGVQTAEIFTIEFRVVFKESKERNKNLLQKRKNEKKKQQKRTKFYEERTCKLRRNFSKYLIKKKNWKKRN